MRSIIALLSTLICVTAASAAEPGWGRACRNDLFTVDVPVGVELTLPAAGDMAIPAEPHWFDPPCFEPTTVVEDIFHDQPALRDRHHRVHFECDGQVVEVTPAAICHVIDALDGALAAHLDPWAVADIFITRECNGTAQSSNQSPPNTAWQFEAMNAPTGLYSAGWNARIAVIDTQSSTAAHNTAQRPAPPTAFPLTPKNAPHANLVIGAIHDLAPAAWIDQYVGLRDPQGSPTSDVAYALKQVIADFDGDWAPLIVNLSLGWPAEMAVHTLYTAEYEALSPPDGTRVAGPEDMPTCVESPVGESVRAALHHLARHRGGDTVSIAAAGNRTVAPTRPAWVVDNGAWEDIGGRFAPAAWASAELKLISVGASRAGGVAGHGFSANRLPDLFAPGRHVPVFDPMAPGQRMPMSGTSLATAYVSGAAAYLADSPGFFFPTPLYTQLLTQARCGAHPNGATSAAGVPGPSYLRLNAADPAVCQAAVAAVPVPKVCTRANCSDRAWPGIVLTPAAAPMHDADNFAHGIALPQPSEPICDDFDCFGRVDKNAKILQAWLDLKQFNAHLMSRLKSLDRVSLAVIARSPFGKAKVLERVELKANGLKQPHYAGAYALGSASLTEFETAQAIAANTAEVQLELHWRGKTSSWTERVALPVHWD